MSQEIGGFRGIEHRAPSMPAMDHDDRKVGSGKEFYRRGRLERDLGTGGGKHVYKS